MIHDSTPVYEISLTPSLVLQPTFTILARNPLQRTLRMTGARHTLGYDIRFSPRALPAGLERSAGCAIARDILFHVPMDGSISYLPVWLNTITRVVGETSRIKLRMEIHGSTILPATITLPAFFAMPSLQWHARPGRRI